MGSGVSHLYVEGIFFLLCLFQHKYRSTWSSETKIIPCQSKTLCHMGCFLWGDDERINPVWQMVAVMFTVLFGRL